MLKVLFIGGIIITLNVLLQALGNVVWLKRMVGSFQKKHEIIYSVPTIRLLVSSFLFLTILHCIQIGIWALFYHFNTAISYNFINELDALYFSFVTFTTLGYGDITLDSEWKLLSGLEAINGIMLIGWSTALMYSLIQHIYKNKL